MFSASACAIHGCSGSGKFVCDPDGTNCRWELGFSCDFGPPYPGPTPYPIPPFNGSRSAPGGDLATVAATHGAEDSNGDGILQCTGVYWVDSGTWTGTCD